MEPKNTRKAFNPIPRTIYANAGGGTFKCIHNLDDGKAVMQNIRSGWTFTAHGIGIYEDGTIDWDFSTGGVFA